MEVQRLDTVGISGADINFGMGYKLVPGKVWETPFGLPDSELRKAGIELLFAAKDETGYVPSPTTLNVIGDLKYGDYYNIDLATSINLEKPKESAFVLTAKDPIKLSNLMIGMLTGPIGPYTIHLLGKEFDFIKDAFDFFDSVVGREIVSIDSDNDGDLDPLLKIVQTPTWIVGELYQPGFEINGKYSIWGADAILKVKGNPFKGNGVSVDSRKLSASLEIPEIDLGWVKLGGVSTSDSSTSEDDQSPPSLNLELIQNPGKQKSIVEQKSNLLGANEDNSKENQSFYLAGDGRLEFLGHEVAKADFEITSTSINVRDFDLDLGLGAVAFDVDNLKVDPKDFSASGSGQLEVLGKEILNGGFDIEVGGLDETAEWSKSILGQKVGLGANVKLGKTDNSVALEASFLGINRSLYIDLDNIAANPPGSIYGWAEDLVKDELAVIALAKAALELVKNPKKVYELAKKGWGKVFNSYIKDAEVFFDANLNGIRDINEPFSMTEADGSYEFPISWEEYDLNQNGIIDPTEGLIVAQGGTYVSSGLPLEAPLTAVPGSEVVTPLTTLVAELSVLLEIEPEVAELQVKSALGLPEEINLGTFNYLDAIANGDANGLKAYAASVQVQNTIVTLTKVLEGAVPESSVSVAKLASAAMGGYAIAASVQEDQSFDLSQPETLQIILESTLDGASNEDEAIDPEQLSEVSELVVQAVTASNQQIQEVANSEGDLTELAKNITQIQKVALGDVAESLSQLAAGTKTVEEFAAETTPEAIRAKIAETVVSDPTFRPEVVQDDSDEDIVEGTEDTSGSDEDIVEDTEDTSGSGEDIVEGTEDTSGSDEDIVEDTEDATANASGSSNTGSSNLQFIGSVIGSGSGSTSETNGFDVSNSIPEIISPVQPEMAEMTASVAEATVESDLMMGNGVEPIFLLDGHDTLMADDGDNWVNGNQGNDMMEVGAGNDTVFGGQDNDTIFGSADNDWMNGNLGADFLDGGEGMDTLYGGEDSDTLQGNIGDDWLSGNKGADFLDGGAGVDILFGGQESDTLQGGADNDELFGNVGADLAEGNDGNDLLHGGQGNDTLSGNDGDDTINGDLGSDLLDGNVGNDILNGGEGDDTVDGGEGNDELTGDAGDDLLLGAEGNDTVTGGEGRDRFVVTPGSGSDVVTDFSDGEDMIVLDEGLTFEQLNMIQENDSTVIRLNSEVLATLVGVNISLITADDFNTSTF